LSIKSPAAPARRASQYWRAIGLGFSAPPVRAASTWRMISFKRSSILFGIFITNSRRQHRCRTPGDFPNGDRSFAMISTRARSGMKRGFLLLPPVPKRTHPASLLRNMVPRRLSARVTGRRSKGWKAEEVACKKDCFSRLRFQNRLHPRPLIDAAGLRGDFF
jgi:hypothetical protein